MYHLILSNAVRATSATRTLILTYLTLLIINTSFIFCHLSLPSHFPLALALALALALLFDCLIVRSPNPFTYFKHFLSQVGAPYLSPSPPLHPTISPCITCFTNSTHPPIVPFPTRDSQLLFIILHLSDTETQLAS